MTWSGDVWSDIELFVGRHLSLRFGHKSAVELLKELKLLSRQPGSSRGRLRRLSKAWRCRWTPRSEVFGKWYSSNWLPARVAEISDMCGRPSQSLLDIGCGDGQLTAAIAERWSIPSGQCVGIDRSVATDVHAGRYLQRMIADVERDDFALKLGGRKFELVCIMQVLHHLRNPQRLLQASRRLLTTNGMLLIRDHNAVTLRDRIFLRFVDDFFQHVVEGREADMFTAYHSLSDWKAMIERSGFKVISINSRGRASLFRQFDILAVPHVQPIQQQVGG